MKSISVTVYCLFLILHTKFDGILSSAVQNETCALGELDTAKKLESATVNAVRALEGFSNFAVDLFKDVTKDSANDPNENVLLSPLSVWSALTASYLGANGQTASELLRTLGLETLSKESVAEAYHILKIWYYLRGENANANYTFRMANKLFFQKGEPIKECILKLLNSEIMTVNFAKRPEAARAKINGWVKKQTAGKIDEIVPPGHVDRSTRMILVNAAYFKGTWEKEFPKELTEIRPFYVQPNKPIYGHSMLQGDIFNMSRNREFNCSIVELPYSSSEISMFILLPFHGMPVEKLIQNLSDKLVKNLISSLKPTSVSLALPRFDMEQSSELSTSLRNMGIRDLFDPVRADLSGFTGAADFSVTKVNHKVFIKVNEQGTEAAAATSLISLRSGVLPEEFHVNRPFVFIIKDNILDAILFMGLIKKPRE